MEERADSDNEGAEGHYSEAVGGAEAAQVQLVCALTRKSVSVVMFARPLVFLLYRPFCSQMDLLTCCKYLCQTVPAFLF